MGKVSLLLSAIIKFSLADFSRNVVVESELIWNERNSHVSWILIPSNDCFPSRFLKLSPNHLLSTEYKLARLVSSLNSTASAILESPVNIWYGFRYSKGNETFTRNRNRAPEVENLTDYFIFPSFSFAARISYLGKQTTVPTKTFVV